MNPIKSLKSFTNEEKIEKFDYLYNYALSMVKDMENKEYIDDSDRDHYAYEEMMSILSDNPRELFKYLNSLTC